MRAASYLLILVGCIGLATVGCTTAPDNSADRAVLGDDTTAALKRMEVEDPDLEAFLGRAYGYAIFPSVGKGALVAGGAYGRGEVYEKGRFAGYADMSQATIGLQAGGQSFSEIVAFESPSAEAYFEAGRLTFAANASAVALKAGSASSAKYDNGVAIFVEPVGGLMLEASIGGQSFSFQPK